MHMTKFKNIIYTLRNEHGLNQEKLATALNVSKSTIAMWETGKRYPSKEKYEEIADYFNVDIDYLYGRTDIKRKIYFDENGNEYTLTHNDERDIAKRLETALADLEDSQNALMFSGEPLDEETRELLKASLENSIRIAKINAKQKYTPKKYRKENN